MALAEWGAEMDQNVQPSKHETLFEINILSELNKAAGSIAGRPLIHRVSQASALSLGNR